MSGKPNWVWKQRSAVARFLVAFYLRRMLRGVCVRLPFLPCGRKRYARPLPSRRRPAEIIATPVDVANRQLKTCG
jgi:hypothetical protein